MSAAASSPSLSPCPCPSPLSMVDLLEQRIRWWRRWRREIDVVEEVQRNAEEAPGLIFQLI